jgi:hypothetical protein
MNKKRIFAISRRPFLAGLGSAAGAAVFIRPILAEAQTGAGPKRFFAYHYPCGTVAGTPPGAGAWGFTVTGGGTTKWSWIPTVAGTGITPTPADATPSSLTALFSAIKSKYLTIHGLLRGDKLMRQNGDKHVHGMVFMMSGWVPVPTTDPVTPEGDMFNAKLITSKTPSIDQQLLNVLPSVFRGPDPAVPGSKQTPFASIQLCGSPYSMLTNSNSYTCLKVISYADMNKPMGGEARSQTAFNNIFGTAMMPGVDPAVFARQQAQKRSILDFVQSDIQRLQPMVPSSQRVKLDAQLTSIRDLEMRITLTPPVVGQVHAPTLVDEPVGAYEGRVNQVLANQLAIIRCAFQSDLTRVATFTAGHGNNADQVQGYFQPPSFAYKGDGHSCSHNGKSVDALLAKGEVSAMFLKGVAKFLADMDATTEGPDTLLDNTFSLVFSECLDGDPHSPTFPMMVAGAKWLKMVTGGKHLNISGDRYVNDFWVPALNALGAPTTTWGDPQYFSAPLPGIFG